MRTWLSLQRGPTHALLHLHTSPTEPVLFFFNAFKYPAQHQRDLFSYFVVNIWGKCFFYITTFLYPSLYFTLPSHFPLLSDGSNVQTLWFHETNKRKEPLITNPSKLSHFHMTFTYLPVLCNPISPSSVFQFLPLSVPSISETSSAIKTV